MPAGEFRYAAANWEPTVEEPPTGASVDRSTWSRMTRYALMSAQSELYANRREVTPTVTDARDELLLVWAIDDEDDPLRLTRLDVRDPDLERPTTTDRLLRTFVRQSVPLGKTDVPVAGATLAAGGGSAAALSNSLLGDPLGGLLAIVAGGVLAVAGGYPLLRQRANRGWRSIDLSHSDPSQRPLPVCRTLLDARARGTWLAQHSEDDAHDAMIALNAIHWLTWEAAGITAAARDSTDLLRLGAIDDAASELRDRLATRMTLTPTLDARAPATSRRTAGRRDLRARVQLVRSLEDADAAIELARLAAADLAEHRRQEI
jgi:hypothetical protein